MLLNYYTIQRWLRENEKRIMGSKFRRAFSFQKNVVYLELEPRAGGMFWIELSFEAGTGHVGLRENFKPKSKNCVEFFGSQKGSIVKTALLLTGDRVLKLELSRGSAIVIRLFGRSLNPLLVDDDNLIADSFKATERNVPFALQRKSFPSTSLIDNEAQFRAELKDTAGLLAWLKKGWLHFDKILYREYVARLEAASSDRDMADAFRVLKEFLDEIDSGFPRIYRRGDIAELFSICGLTHLEAQGLLCEKFDTTNAAIYAYVSSKGRTLSRETALQELLQVCRAQKSKNTKLVKKLGEDLKEAEGYERSELKGTLLNIHVAELKKGMPSVRLENVYEPGTFVEIDLDPALKVHENVERYFNRARKLKRSRAKIQTRLNMLKEELVEFEQLEKELAALGESDSKRLSEIRKDFVGRGWLKAESAKSSLQRGTAAAATRFSFKEFTVSGGWRVLLGGSAEKNDYLTFKVAKKDDLWFHARDVPGSHVVLITAGRRDNPGQVALEQAAALAAFHSKAAGSRVVPVICTAKKYVRKPKGFARGKVIVEQEKVLIVEPAVPREAE